MNAGYVRIYRTLTEKGYYKESDYVHLWVHLIMKATYQDKEYLFNNKIEHLMAGQFICGRKSLSKETGIQESKIERILNCFESEQQIIQQKNNKFRIISILNWCEYQTDGQQVEQPVNNQRTTSEQPVNTNNKDNKEKKEKKETISDFYLPKNIKPETWNAYLEMRKAIKKPATLHAQKLIIQKLLKMSGDPNLILNQSIEGSWQNVYELKTGGNNGNYKTTGNREGNDKGGFGIPPIYEGEQKPTDQEIQRNIENIKKLTEKATHSTDTTKK